MKTPANTLTLLAYVALASAGTAAIKPMTPDAICEDLGIMNIEATQLPQGVALTDIRMCADHPLGRNRTLDPLEGASLAPMDADEQHLALADGDTAPAKRACYKAAPYGCSGGYCWKACGDLEKGEWCWTAGLGGAGSWAKCTSYLQCGVDRINFGCGKGCSC